MCVYIIARYSVILFRLFICSRSLLTSRFIPYRLQYNCQNESLYHSRVHNTGRLLIKQVKKKGFRDCTVLIANANKCIHSCSFNGSPFALIFSVAFVYVWAIM